MKISTKVTMPAQPQSQPKEVTNNVQFELIEPGYYTAIVRGTETATFRAGFKGYPNPAADDGKWTYLKTTPAVEVLNPNKTIINRQDLTISVFEDGQMIRPDGNTEKSAIFSGETGAGFFLSQMGCYDYNTKMLTLDDDLIINRVVRIRIGIAGYRKGVGSYNTGQFHEMLTEANDGDDKYTLEDLPRLIGILDTRDGYSGDAALKTKNVITGWYSVGEGLEDFYTAPDGNVYLSEDDYVAVLNIQDEQESGW